MSYPESTPILKGEDAEEFSRRLKHFKLSKSQKEFYKDALKGYEKTLPKE
jgi:hypothetical protein